MNFKQWLNDKIDKSSNVRKKAQELIDNYNKDFKIGFGVVKQPEELAALLYAAQNNYPPNTKHNAILNTFNLPELYTPGTTQHEMWKMVRDLKIPITKMDNGNKSIDSYIVGKDAHLLNNIIKTMHSKEDKENPDSEENLEMLNFYRKQIGKLLGYTDKSIQAFIDRSNKMARKVPVPDVHDHDFINSVRENFYNYWNILTK